jgi:hypothetical protein
VSVTTRPRRGSEIEGVHYQFKSHREFERMRDSEALLEWAEVHGNCYGTPREAAEVAMAEGRDMLFDIDVDAVMAVRVADGAGLAEMLDPEGDGLVPATEPSQDSVAGWPSITVMIRCNGAAGAHAGVSIWMRGPRCRADRSRCAAVQPAFSRSAEVTASTPMSRRPSPIMARRLDRLGRDGALIGDHDLAVRARLAQPVGPVDGPLAEVLVGALAGCSIGLVVRRR